MEEAVVEGKVGPNQSNLALQDEGGTAITAQTHACAELQHAMSES